MTPRARFVTCATALAMHRGGMAPAGPLVVALSEAHEALPVLSVEDMLRPMHRSVDAVLDARLAGDEFRYGEAHYALATQTAIYWALKAREVAA
ncbi:hypothetical protein KZZ07_26365 [Mameliella sp. CS4]|uniref:hypothetical protein n=1 Tax=Mameliella sp. CS4 TaxID=2862329 RepID=UPI001C5D2FB9|nr:hypothetical protein [Mameliella sp. CS4]MBW4986055.1 hypothetical protein [Mameliella sp. CS4]